jgi:hypothetical protein
LGETWRRAGGSDAAAAASTSGTAERPTAPVMSREIELGHGTSERYDFLSFFDTNQTTRQTVARRYEDSKRGRFAHGRSSLEKHRTASAAFRLHLQRAGPVLAVDRLSCVTRRGATGPPAGGLWGCGRGHFRLRLTPKMTFQVRTSSPQITSPHQSRRLKARSRGPLGAGGVHS